MIELNIVPECDVDTMVAEIVGQARKGYNHKHGKDNVANELKKLKDKVILGIVDEDKGKGVTPNYFTEFETITVLHNLILKKHKGRKQYLILICPEIEKWLLTDSVFAGIDPSEFGLPNQLHEFKMITKTRKIHKNIGFHRFIKALIRANAPSITALKTWIELFKNDELDTLLSE
jgi:hypothetical protein